MNIQFTFCIFVCIFVAVCHSTATSMKDAIDMELNKLKAMLPPVPDPLGLNSLVGGAKVNQTYCTCAVFLSGQFTKGSNQPPLGNPALLHEQENVMACNPMGSKQCTNKCLETVKLKISPLFPCCCCYMFTCVSKIFRLPSTCQIHRSFCAAALIVTYTKNVHTSSFKTAMANGRTQIYRPVVNSVAKKVLHSNARWHKRNL